MYNAGLEREVGGSKRDLESNGAEANKNEFSVEPAKEFDVEIEDEREKWGNKAEFLLSCVGYAVGLGNIWRFPYLCYRNGGATFLIPYLIMLALCGLPMFYMELALGQFMSLGPVGCWGAICPLFKGIGWAMVMLSFLVSIYYNVIITWALYYMFHSFAAEVPWKTCNHEWNDPERCVSGSRKLLIKPFNCTYNNGTEIVTEVLKEWKNCTNVNESSIMASALTPVSPSEEFWEKYVLDMTDSIDDIGGMDYRLALTLLFAWIMIYFCVWKGVKSSGKVVYFTATFPYIVLVILFFRGVTLKGAEKGIIFYLKPEWSRLLDPQVWVQAATQIFYSLGVGFGSLIAMGSYNKFHNNVFRDAYMVALINCGTSVFGGFVIFSVLGFMADFLDVDVSKVAADGPGLAFVVYPEGISQMPVSPLWAILFFFMLLTLGLDSQFAMCEVVITSLVDEFRKLRKLKPVMVLGLCVFWYFIGLPCVAKGGIYVVTLMDWQTGGISLLVVAFFECIAVSWFFGADRFADNVEVMTGNRPNAWWLLCWKYISPAVTLVIFFASLIQWKGVSYSGKQYPDWAEFVGWMLACASMFLIPIFAVVGFVRGPGSTWDRFMNAISPDEGQLMEVEVRERIQRKNLVKF